MDSFDTAFTDEGAELEAMQRREQAMAEQRAAIEGLVSARLRDAIQAKENSGIEQIWLEDEDQYNGYDAVNPPTAGPNNTKEQREAEKKPSPRSTVFLNITKPKTDSAVARVTELAVPHDDRPWEIGPTPVPELEKAAAGQDNRQITLKDGTQAPARDVAKAAIERARAASKRMADHIEDWMVEGGVYAEWRKVIRDAGRIGTGVVKGPFPVMRKDKKWVLRDGAHVLEVVERLAPTSKRIDPWDLYPDPSCGDDIHAGAYVFERDFLTGRKLRELAELPGYDRSAIAQILRDGPRKRSRADRYMRQKQGEVPDFDTGTFEVFYYYGDIPPEHVIGGGFKVPGLTVDAEGNDFSADDLATSLDEALQLATIPIVVTMVNDRIVRMSMNPLETGDFPFDVFPWEPVDGQPWGRGIPRKMDVAQRILNAAVRALLENAGVSGGPQVVTASGAIQPWDGNYSIQGRKGWHFTPNELIDDVRKAFAFFTIDSAQQQLQAIIEFALRMADELSNLPLLLQGAVGGAPDTVGGMAMLQQNAASPLKQIAKLGDDKLFEPQIKRYYAWGMQDPSVPAEAKGDFQCKARASTALIARDQAAAVLPQVLPMAKDPAFGLSPERTMEATLRANKVNPEDVTLTEDEKKARDEAAQNQPQDPRIQAAEITAEQRNAQVQAQIEDSQRERESRERIAAVEFQIQAMEFAGQKEISLEELKAMLAKTAIDSRTKQDMQARELAYATGPGEGEGI